MPETPEKDEKRVYKAISPEGKVINLEVVLPKSVEKRFLRHPTQSAQGGIKNGLEVVWKVVIFLPAWLYGFIGRHKIFSFISTLVMLGAALLAIGIILVAGEISEKREFDKYFRLCAQSYENGLFEPALEYCDKALEVKSNNAIVLDYKGVSLFGLGRYQEAIEYFDKALEINPEDFAILTNKGNALLMLGNLKEASKYFDKALAINPNCQQARSSKARIPIMSTTPAGELVGRIEVSQSGLAVEVSQSGIVIATCNGKPATLVEENGVKYYKCDGN